MGSFNDRLEPVSAAEQWRAMQRMNRTAQQQMQIEDQRQRMLAGLANQQAAKPLHVRATEDLAWASGCWVSDVYAAAPSILRHGLTPVKLDHADRRVLSVTVLRATTVPRVERRAQA